MCIHHEWHVQHATVEPHQLPLDSWLGHAGISSTCSDFPSLFSGDDRVLPHSLSLYIWFCHWLARNLIKLLLFDVWVWNTATLWQCDGDVLRNGTHFLCLLWSFNAFLLIEHYMYQEQHLFPDWSVLLLAPMHGHKQQYLQISLVYVWIFCTNIILSEL